MWICCQLGAREHYSVPRALRLNGQLQLLITDVWSGGRQSVQFLLGKRAADRFHPALEGANIASANFRYVVTEPVRRARHSGWRQIMARNEWFQSFALSALEKHHRLKRGEHVVFFAYSYAAQRLFEFARSVGWTTILGQIDGAREEDRLMTDLHRSLTRYGSHWNPAPDLYWEGWERECLLADHIVVNSQWARGCLTAAGIPEKGLVTIPLAYEPDPATVSFNRVYPSCFTRERPLRILFLGQVNLRKGVSAILEAVDNLGDEPVEFRMVGPVQLSVPPRYLQHPKIKWAGPVPRSEAAKEYQQADVFLFPTYSDGFGITQLEAQSWKLPVIASQFCGEVVRHQKNGYLLPAVSSEAVSSAIRFFLENPQSLAEMSSQSSLAGGLPVSGLSERLVSLLPDSAFAV